MKKLRRIYYFWKYFNFYRDSPSYEKLDVLIIYLEKVGVKSVEYNDNYHCCITFNDGTIFKFWNCNLWYAWMSSGEINFSNGTRLSWREKMPYSEVLYKYKKFIKSIKNQKNETDFSEYLPQKLLRKIKLQKLQRS